MYLVNPAQWLVTMQLDEFADLAATWLEGKPMGVRWFAIAALYVCLLLGANVGRVALLVLVGQVFAARGIRRDLLKKRFDINHR